MINRDHEYDRSESILSDPMELRLARDSLLDMLTIYRHQLRIEEKKDKKNINIIYDLKEKIKQLNKEEKLIWKKDGAVLEKINMEYRPFLRQYYKKN